MPLTVTMQTVVLANVSQLKIVHNPNGSFTGTAEYVVLDSFGTIWKNNRFSFAITDGTVTLNQMVSTMLAGINGQEGTA